MASEPSAQLRMDEIRRVLPVYVVLGTLAIAPIIYLVIAVYLATAKGGSLSDFKGYLSGLTASSVKNITMAAWTLGGIAAVLSVFLAISLRKFLRKMVFDIRRGQKSFGNLMFSRVIIFLAIGESAAIFGFVGFMLTGDAVLLLGLSAASLLSNLLWTPPPAWAVEDWKEERTA